MASKQDNPATGSVSSLAARSMEAFYRDLRGLLQKHSGKWVAYHGEECFGVGRTETELYQKCLRQGLKEGEFIVLFADRAALADQEEIELPLNP
jgi:hypothetical protein